MRIVLSATPWALWAQSIEHPTRLGFVTDRLYNRVIASIEPTDFEALKSDLKQRAKTNDSDKKLLEVLLKMPLTHNVARPPVDGDINNWAPESDHTPIETALKDARLAQVYENRNAAVKVNESRDHIYERSIQPLALSAKGVTCLDPYAIDQLVERREGIGWLLGRLFEDGLEYINIYAVMSNDETITEEQIKSGLDAILLAAGRTGIRINLHYARGVVPHERHLRFQFRDSQRDTPAVSLGKGFDNFNHVELNAGCAVRSEQPEGPRDRENMIKQARGASKISRNR